MQAFAPFLTGLGLFFCGVHLIATHLVPLAGRRIRYMLTRLGKHPWLAAVVGSLAGVATQSTNAVTAVIIGLVGGGMVDKRRAIVVPTWSHVGTSVLVILVAIDFRVAAGYLVAIAGIAAYFGLDRSDRMRHAVGTLLGMGLLLIGMQLLKVSTEPLREDLMRESLFLAGAQLPWVLLALGAVMALVCQSSSVAGALAVAGTSAGLFDLTGACWLIFGANLGSGANYVMLAKAHRGEPAQIALMQVVQKLIGFAVMMIIMAFENITGDRLIETTAMALAANVTGQLALVFLFYQLVGSTLCTLFVDQIMPLLERLAPPSDLQELSKPAFLIEDALVEPTFALELVGREEHRLLERIPAMLDTVRADAEGTPVPPATLRSASVAVGAAMTTYLGSILEADLERADRDQAVRLQHRTSNLSALFEALDEFVGDCVATRQSPSAARVADQMVESLHTLLGALVDATAANDAAEREFILTLLGHRDELMERIRQRVLREDPSMPAKAQEALFAATMLFERIIWLARRSALLLAPERPVESPALATAS
jgi:phosphate:Na+ symporter